MKRKTKPSALIRRLTALLILRIGMTGITKDEARGYKLCISDLKKVKEDMDGKVI
jgi:hypothetical protein